MTTSTETALGTLTKNDVKALRTADRVSFLYGRNDDGKAYSIINAIKRVKNPGPFDPSELAYEIDAPSEFRGKGIDRLTVRAFAAVASCQFSEEWMTIADMLKAGDEVSLLWYADGEANGYVERSVIQGEPHEAGTGMQLHADALYLKVKRGNKRYSFLLYVGLCPDNTARMIRH